MKETLTFDLITKIGKIQKAKRTNSSLPVAKGEMEKELCALIRAGKDFEIRDTEVAGLVLRVRPSGKMAYTLVYARGKRFPIGAADAIDHNQARAIGRKKLAELHMTGEDLIEKQKRDRVKADTYLDFLNETYKPWLKANLLHGEYAYTTLVKSFPELHQLTLEEITPGVIEKWRMSQLERGLKPVTVNRQLSDLRACLNRAKDIWELRTSSLDKVKPSKIDRSPKVRYLTPDDGKTIGEETRLRQALDSREQAFRDGRDSGNRWREVRGYRLFGDFKGRAFVDHLKPAVLVSLNTGLRRGELLKLRWENISFEQRMLTVVGNTSKTGKTRHIPLNDEALNTLKKWKDQPGLKSAYVFGDSTGEPLQGMKTSWQNLLVRARVNDFRWHDLRHTFASKLVMAGVDLNTVRELLGHSDYKMTLRYAHLAPRHKQDAVDKLVAAKVTPYAWTNLSALAAVRVPLDAG